MTRSRKIDAAGLMRRMGPVIAGVAVLALAHLTGAQATSALRLVKTIELPRVEGRIDHMAYDARSARLYVAALGNNTVEVIDVKAGKVIHAMAGLAEPQGVGVIQSAERIYVANARDGSCRIFDGRSYRQIGSVDLKSDADNVRYDANGSKVYVGHGDGALAVLDARSGALLSDIQLPSHPESFQLEKTGTRIFVNLPGANAVIAVIDRAKGAVMQTWSITGASSNFPMALDEASKRLFVGCRKPPRVVVIDTQTGKQIAALDCAADADDVWFDEAGKRIYISGGEGRITVIRQSDPNTYAVAGQVTTAPGARTSFFVPDRRMLYVAVPHRGARKSELRVYQARD